MSSRASSPSVRPELAWASRPMRELVQLSWPITVSFLSFGVMTFVDTLFVSSLGTAALAGVGLADLGRCPLVCREATRFRLRYHAREHDAREQVVEVRRSGAHWVACASAEPAELMLHTLQEVV